MEDHPFSYVDESKFLNSLLTDWPAPLLNDQQVHKYVVGNILILMPVSWTWLDRLKNLKPGSEEAE